MKGGSVSASGGGGLSPGSVDHVSPQMGGFVLMLEAKPLKLFGAIPPLSTFSKDQSSPQN